MTRSIFSYIVRYDSGFAPNPFFDYCTLATCKPKIREHASVGDWVVGTGSGCAGVRRSGFLVYAMKVTEILKTADYWNDPRFQCKKPEMHHNWVAASGDNIYEPVGPSQWRQLNSYHSNPDGTPHDQHKSIDTEIERVLVSDDYIYYGGEGPKLPKRFLPGGCMKLCHTGRHYKRVQDENVIGGFLEWLSSLNHRGYEGKPWDWVCRRK